MTQERPYHLVVIEAYEGPAEFLSDQDAERRASVGLGLPLEEIADELPSRITILSWEEWYVHEPPEITPTPATRPISFVAQRLPQPDSLAIKRKAIPAIDPDTEHPIGDGGFSSKSLGLIYDSGLLFFLSCCLDSHLRRLYRADPFHAVILPMWGGLGYVFQTARATHAPDHIDIPTGIVVTGISADRQAANEEGLWTRQAIVRRQMEDLSLALADIPLVFGSRGREIAMHGRLPEASPPVLIPRRVAPESLDIIRAQLNRPTPEGPLQLFLHEPQDGASGVLVALDAVRMLNERGVQLPRPLISSGPSVVSAPTKPRTLQNYWSSRGWVRELMRDHQWQWRSNHPNPSGTYPVRLYPSCFEHLPNVWAELAAGSLVVLSPAASEGLALEESLPKKLLLSGEATPGILAACLADLLVMPTDTLEELRQELCRSILAGHAHERRRPVLAQAVAALEQLLDGTSQSQDLGRIALLFLDRRLPLRAIVETDRTPTLPSQDPNTKTGTLSVVVTCYEMGAMVTEAIESVWASERLPDEILLIDDGSQEEVTLTQLHDLEKRASEKRLPLTVIHQRNQGISTARNTGLDAAKGEFISFLDGDDLIEPGFYGTAIALLERYARLGGVGAWARIFEGLDGYWNAPQPELPFLFAENSVIVPCMMRTRIPRQLGGYDVQQRYNYEDWDLGMKLLACGWPIVNIPRHLLRYRHRADSRHHGMTNVQNQVMRELLLTKHRDTASRFAVEITMQIENRLHRLLNPDPQPTSTPDSAPMINPVISAVICTHNRAPYLRKALHSLIQQSLPQEQYEILVVDNCCTDITKEVVEEFAGAGPVRYHYESRLGLSHARNTGWRSARGRYVAYLDDDAIACPEWLEKILEVFETVKPRPGCVGGRTEAIWEAQRPTWLGDHLLHCLTIVDWSDVPRPLPNLDLEWLVGANFALPREILEDLGGFTERLDRQGSNLLSSGDVFLQKQVLCAGLTCFYHPQVFVQHHVFPSRLVQGWFKRRYYWQGVSDAVMYLLEYAPSKTALVRLAFAKIIGLLACPRKLLNVALTTNDPGRFTEACFTLITLGQIRGLLVALRQ